MDMQKNGLGFSLGGMSFWLNIIPAGPKGHVFPWRRSTARLKPYPFKTKFFSYLEMPPAGIWSIDPARSFP